MADAPSAVAGAARAPYGVQASWEALEKHKLSGRYVSRSPIAGLIDQAVVGDLARTLLLAAQREEHNANQKAARDLLCLASPISKLGRRPSAFDTSPEDTNASATRSITPTNTSSTTSSSSTLLKRSRSLESSLTGAKYTPVSARPSGRVESEASPDALNNSFTSVSSSSTNTSSLGSPDSYYSSASSSPSPARSSEPNTALSPLTNPFKIKKSLAEAANRMATRRARVKAADDEHDDDEDDQQHAEDEGVLDIPASFGGARKRLRDGGGPEGGEGREGGVLSADGLKRARTASPLTAALVCEEQDALILPSSPAASSSGSYSRVSSRGNGASPSYASSSSTAGRSDTQSSLFVAQEGEVLGKLSHFLQEIIACAQRRDQTVFAHNPAVNLLRKTQSYASVFHSA